MKTCQTCTRPSHKKFCFTCERAHRYMRIATWAVDDRTIVSNLVTAWELIGHSRRLGGSTQKIVQKFFKIAEKNYVTKELDDNGIANC
jgi:hypothetical protein